MKVRRMAGKDDLIIGERKIVEEDIQGINESKTFDERSKYIDQTIKTKDKGDK